MFTIKLVRVLGNEEGEVLANTQYVLSVPTYLTEVDVNTGEAVVIANRAEYYISLERELGYAQCTITNDVGTIVDNFVAPAPPPAPLLEKDSGKGKKEK